MIERPTVSERAAAYVAAFNASTRSGDWASFAQRFAPDATMRFLDVPVGPFNGREAIAAGYSARPPTETLAVTCAVSTGDLDELRFAWESGATGTMTLRWSGQLVAELTVSFA